MRGEAGGAGPRVVVVGAGFGGLWAARALAGSPAEVTILDRHNYHTFLPLLYQVAAAELEPDDIAYPVRGIVRRLPNVGFLMAEVTGVDLGERQVLTDGGPIPYDYLILAAGSRTNFFRMESVARCAFELKEIGQAVILRSHILRLFERALREPDPELRRALLTFVVVGGGPTGIEFSGALAELVYGVLARDYIRLDFSEVRILLLEAMDRLLPALPEELQTYAKGRLEAKRVEVRLGAAVTRATDERVYLKDGTSIATRTLVWTAGVQASDLAAGLGVATARGGRVVVNPTLQLPDHPEVSCIGDMAYLEDEAGRPLPQVAPVAIQQGEHAARNIRRQIEGRKPLPFRYHDRGTMVTIGRNAAVAQVRGRPVRGFPAWLAWLGVHLVNLIGFRNRLLVLVNWAWSYLFYDRGVRLISESEPARSQERSVPR
ncbi:pyridine nucleotide-disulfide oxidoreductase [Limnochorda pilosa]|uniref:NADH:ubiquinone reductase (non-electrogenic) n=1 Tax=Limnochorda pilosa TaxID=1555112 RepID=A0A0K2SH67_LIMPI|nr:pyridine nucleotide-disulfide oxidoreductase [Limnochorda pilosa]